MTMSFAEALEANLEETFKEIGSIVEGTVVRIDRDYVIVDTGLKSESPIPIHQFKDANGELTVSVGDTVEVALDSMENGDGVTILSRDRAKRMEMWRTLEAASEANETVTGQLMNRVKGGFTVNLGSVRAFLPGSQIDVRPLKEVDHLEGKDLEFKVIKIDAKRNNVVVSRKAVLEEHSSVDREALLNNLEEGAVVKGIVKNLTDYGVFIDLGGIDGLLHITDMSWKRIRHPSEIVTVGDELEVKVMRFEREKQRVSLGLKQMGSDPWVNAEAQFPVGKKVTGKVTNIADYGCFVELGDGIEGLVHVSEMDWSNKNVNPHKLVSLGQEVEVVVLEVDPSRRRISLGLKQCRTNPWDDFDAKQKVGDKVSGVIKSITDFGIFIGLDGNIDGLIHMSDLSWTDSGEDIVSQYKKGDTLEAVILAIDVDRERISLGLKQLENDPFSDFTSKHKKMDALKLTVKEVEEAGAVVSIEGFDETEGFIKASDIARERVADARQQLKADDQIEAAFVGFDRRNSRILFSIKAMEEHEERQATAAYKPSENNKPSSTSIGDLIKEKMNKS